MGKRSSDYWLIIALLAQTFLLNIAIQRLQLSYHLHGKYLVLGANLFSLSFYFLVFLAIKKMFDLKQQRQLTEQKDTALENMQSLLRAVRFQRHDIINHLDTVYALLSLHKYTLAQEYAANFVQLTGNTSHIMQLEQPVVAAFLQNKATQALAKDIKVYIEVSTSLRDLAVKPYVLVTILGNLLENAMEAVEPLPADRRQIEVDISESEKYYCFSISNSGPPLERSIENTIFQPGVSTKGPERGLGLATVREMAISSGGTVEIKADPVTFLVKLPRMVQNK